MSLIFGFRTVCNLTGRSATLPPFSSDIILARITCFVNRFRLYLLLSWILRLRDKKIIRSAIQNPCKVWQKNNIGITDILLPLADSLCRHTDQTPKFLLWKPVFLAVRLDFLSDCNTVNRYTQCDAPPFTMLIFLMRLTRAINSCLRGRSRNLSQVVKNEEYTKSIPSSSILYP